MLFSILRGASGIEIAILFLARLFVVFCTLPVHEYAHAFVADKLGDKTARLSGRLTLNPMAHIDILGAIMILFVGFGYAKPVPVNPRNFKNPKKGMALTALSGPFSNILMAVVFMLLSNVLSLFGSSLFVQAFYVFFSFAASINIGLAVFNLIPIPPLDGSRVLELLIPDKYYYKFAQYERYIVIVIFGLIVFGVLDAPLAFLQNHLYSALNYIVSLPFRAFKG
ncbi:MAG: site-2 protease family protein [Ruminococcus sp.]|nr:site-2 protease family protein [Ruminococcus sp.]MDD7344317.1 site-2 protease family protein [Ruminococcus sp.]MDY4910185.1 site-2 protease family protein [Candidatus Fimenecus sp.]